MRRGVSLCAAAPDDDFFSIFLKTDSIGGGDANQVFIFEGDYNDVTDSTIIGGENNDVYVYYGSYNYVSRCARCCFSIHVLKVDDDVVGGSDNDIGVYGELFYAARNDVEGNTVFGLDNAVFVYGDDNYVDYNAISGGFYNDIFVYNSADSDVLYSTRPLFVFFSLSVADCSLDGVASGYNNDIFVRNSNMADVESNHIGGGGTNGIYADDADRAQVSCWFGILVHPITLEGTVQCSRGRRQLVHQRRSG